MKSSSVEQHDYRLVALDLVLAGDHPSAPGCCGPRDVAQLVALNVVSQTFELPPLAAHRSTSQAGEQVAVPTRKKLVSLGFFEVRIDLDILCRRNASLPCNETKWRRPPDPYISKPIVSTSSGKELISCRRWHQTAIERQQPLAAQLEL